MIYDECASSCPKTCYSPKGTSCNEPCYPDCRCPDGMFIDINRNFTCVQLNQCMCTYSGTTYAPGSSITADCNNW